MVIAVTNPTDAHHRAAAEELSRRRKSRQEIRLSTIAIAELHALKGPGRAKRLDLVDRFVNALGPNAIIGIDRQTAELAGATRAARPSLHIADALIKATAEQLGGEVLTADRSLARLDGVKLLRASR